MAERVRCAKHNWLDPITFRLRYRGGMWDVLTDDDLEFRFPFNPYTSFFEIGGYLRQGLWRLEPGMCVVDAGGGRGEFALYAARKVGPGGHVYMLEPDAQSRAMAGNAFEANGGKPDNLTVLPQGLWKEPGVLNFAAGLGGSSVLADAGTDVARQARESADLVRIDVHSLPSLVRAYGIQRLDLIKMDIEGAELEVVEGALPLLPDLRPKFTIAAYHLRDGKPTSKLLEPLFHGAGYHAQTGFPAHPTTYASAEPFPD